jgi:hypothetical protein
VPAHIRLLYSKFLPFIFLKEAAINANIFAEKWRNPPNFAFLTLGPAQQANPAMKTAVKSVRDGGKLAYKEMKHKIRENQSRKTFSAKKQSVSLKNSSFLLFI